MTSRIGGNESIFLGIHVSDGMEDPTRGMGSDGCRSSMSKKSHACVSLAWFQLLVPTTHHPPPRVDVAHWVCWSSHNPKPCGIGRGPTFLSSHVSTSSHRGGIDAMETIHHPICLSDPKTTRCTLFPTRCTPFLSDAPSKRPDAPSFVPDALGLEQIHRSVV